MAAISWLAAIMAFWIHLIYLGQLNLIAAETTTFEVKIITLLFSA